MSANQRVLFLFGNRDAHKYTTKLPSFDTEFYQPESNDEVSNESLMYRNQARLSKILRKALTLFPDVETLIVAPYGTVFDLSISEEKGNLCPDFLPLVQGYQQIRAVQILSENYLFSVKGTPEYFWDSNWLPFLNRNLFGGTIRYGNYDPETKDTDGQLFLVPSVINCSGKPLSYSNHRSIFSNQERLLMTEKQIFSIKDKYQNSKVYLLEGSAISISDLIILIRSGVDRIYPFFLKQSGKYFASECPNKSLFEIYAIIEVLKDDVFISNFTHVFKFGGRYSISQFHQSEKFIRDKPVFKEIPAHLTYAGKNIFECILYSIPFEYLKDYLDILERLLNNPDSNIERDLRLSYSNFIRVDSLDVEGADAIHGIYKIV